jgi:hypothetical protein
MLALTLCIWLRVSDYLRLVRELARVLPRQVMAFGFKSEQELIR